MPGGLSLVEGRFGLQFGHDTVIVENKGRFL
jgi:hypothetical protein